MKSYELKPTYENLLETYINDTIGRSKDVFLFSQILNGIESSCAVALDGSWGSGKTFFVKQTKMLLDAYNDNVNQTEPEDRETIKSVYTDGDNQFQPQVCVYYDAWENDSDDDPILSLILTIIKDMDTDYTFSNNETFIKKAATVLGVFTGRDWNEMIESFQGNNPFDKIRENKKIEADIKEFLEDIIREKGNRLVVFIDELDRCRPSYAVKLLERIKHYFSNDNITFVFSVNINELQHTIKKYYGETFDACRYLDRFFDLRITLPPPDKIKFYHNINFGSTYTYDIVCRAVIEHYNLSLREIAKYVQLTKIAAYEPTHSGRNFDFSFPDGRGRLFCLMYILPIMIGLKICDIQKYYDFIRGRDSSPLIDVVMRLQHHHFDDLLSSRETFNSNEEGKTFITIDKKMKEIYNALFLEPPGTNTSCITIGDYEFGAGVKELLLRTESLLSRYSNMNVD